MNRKVIYTAIFGNYNGLIPQPTISGFDFICFTDNPKLKAKPWKVVKIEPPIAGDMTRSNRYIKILPHKYVSKYDISIYIDGNMLIVGDMNHLTKNYLLDHDMAAFSHAFTIPDQRDCIYDEYKAVLALEKEDSEILNAHIKKLKKDNYPPNNGLIKGGCIARRHNNSKVIKVMEDWWYMVEHYSKRDQMSFNYVAWKNKFEYATIPGDIRKNNPYIYWLGNHRSNWKTKLAKVKLKIKLGLIKIPKA